MRPTILASMLAVAGTAWTADLAIDCGGERHVVGGVTFVADRAYDPIRGSGYFGGVRRGHAVPMDIGGSDADVLYRDARGGRSFGYRFDVPDGGYAVTLYFCESDVYGPGLRSFTATLEGSPALVDLDLAAVAGKQYAYEPRLYCLVKDGHLDVELAAKLGEAELSAIAVAPIVPDGTPPAPPSGLAALSGFQETILQWKRGSEPDLAGYLVWRSTDGLFQKLTPAPVPLGRFLDGTAPSTALSTYRLAAVDLFGNASAAAEVHAAPPLPPGATTLPVYDLALDAPELRHLLADPFRDILSHGTFASGETSLPAGIRHRGNTSRYFGKPSLKVLFPKGVEFAGRRALNLKAEPGSASLLNERLSIYLFRLADVPAPEVQPVHLRLNGQYRGVYHECENVDSRFLTTRGFAKSAVAFKAAGYMMWPYPTFAQCELKLERHGGGPERQEEIWRLLDELETINEGEFDDWLAERFDREELASFLACAALLSNGFDGGSYYIVEDARDGRFLLVPWDLNNESFGQRDGQVAPVVDHPVLRNALQAFGVNYNRFNLLWTRALLAPRMRNLLADRIEALAKVMAGPAFLSAIDAAQDEIRVDALADVRKAGFEDPGRFLAGAQSLKDYVGGRLAFLQGKLPEVRQPARPLWISEAMVLDRATLADDHGEHEPWVEIENRTPETRSAAGLYLSDNVRDRTKWALPASLQIPAGGRLVLWLDGQPAQGPRHAPFRLDPHRGSLTLSDGVAKRTLDVLFFGAQIPDVAYGRLRRDPERHVFLAAATPGAPNADAASPLLPIERVAHAPLFPGPGDSVTVRARIQPIGLSGATVEVDDGNGHESVALHDDGLHGDGAAGDGLYAAAIAARPAGTEARYYVTARYGDLAQIHSPLDAPFLRHSYRVHGLTPPPLFINEVMPRNQSTVADENGQYEDWAEIYNGGELPIDLAGMYLSDDAGEPSKWQFPEGTVIDPGRYLLVWLDGEPDDGPLHASFKLKGRGDQLLLTHRYEDGAIPIDAVSFPALSPDVAWARCPDGAAHQMALSAATPRAGNRCPIVAP